MHVIKAFMLKCQQCKISYLVILGKSKNWNKFRKAFELLLYQFRIIWTFSKMILDGIPQVLYNLSRIVWFYNCRARHNHIGPSLSTFVNSCWTYTAINFNIQSGIVLPQMLHFWHHVWHEFLSSKSGFHGHNQNHVSFFYVLLN